MNFKNSREVQSNLVPLYLKNKRLGKVHSKFQNGLNIQFDDKLIYISHTESPLSAYGINIDKNKLQEIIKMVDIKDIVVFKEGKFIFYSAYKNITLNLENIELIDLRIPKIQISKKEIKNTNLYNILKEYDFEKNIGLNLDDRNNYYIDLLVESDKKNLNLNQEIIKFFSGRGKGLTPSGDDILIGFTTALLSFTEENIYHEWIKDIILLINKKVTTEISVAYIRSLIEGYLNYNFIELIYSINFKENKYVYEVIEKIKNFGHTSGSDTLFGFFLGLKFLSNN